ncbi:MAG TPA: biopolymer transporter ExbD [Ohtaekwangia sp.]
MAAIQQPTSEGKGTSRSKTALYIDMTPMVDLAFLLLTFFVMTSVLTKPHSLGLQMPDNSEEGEPPPIPASKVLNLILAENDKIYWYRGDGSSLETTTFSSAGIRKLLLDKKAEINKLYVLIKASDQSKYKNVIDILDELEITAITRYSLVDVDDTDRRLIAEARL